MANLLDQFDFSKFDGVQENFINKGLTEQVINTGGGGTVSTFVMSGHDKGIAYRFFLTPVRSGVKSEEFDMEINDEIECIEWHVSRDFKPVERVTMIGDALLKFAKVKKVDNNGRTQMVLKKPLECVGGSFKEAYLAFKKGLSAAGLPLQRWDRLTLAQISSLNSLNIFTVQQFAAMPTERINDGRFPPDLIEAFHQAVQWVNGQKPMQDVQAYAEKVLLMKQELTKQQEEINKLKAEIIVKMQSKMDTEIKPAKKKPGRPKKIVEPTVIAEPIVTEDITNGN